MENSQFNAIEYFKRLCETNKLCLEHEFFCCTNSGPDDIGELAEQYKKRKNFIMVDDLTSQQTYSNGVGFFDKNVYTVNILARYRWDDPSDRAEKLNLCRRIFHQFHARLIHDKAMWEYGEDDCSLEFLDVEHVYSREFPAYFSSDLTGLYFMLNNDEPVDLTYNEEDWK